MYKLVIVAGKLRGEEYILDQKEMVLGRDAECEIHLPIDGISKKHLKFFISEGSLYVEDLKSANGTFVNGKLVKRGSLSDGDKISIPDTIIQIVYVEERKVYVNKVVLSSEEDDDDPFSPRVIPNGLAAKFLYYFKYKFMNIVHNFNTEYEWRVLFAILLFIFIVINISLTIFPILLDSKLILLHEVAKRGAHYAEEIGRINARALEQKQLDQVKTNFLNTEDGVESYELFDLDGRIVRPLGKLNDYISDNFSVQVREWAMKTRAGGGEEVLKKQLDSDKIGIGRKIMAFNSKLGESEPVGVIAIKFAPKSLAVEAVKSSKAYLETLITSAIAALVFFAIIYYLTTRPIEEMRYQIELALRGKIKALDSKYLMSEVGGLRNSINALLQRLRELQKDEFDSDLDEIEPDDNYVLTLSEFMIGAGVPCMVLNSEKNISKINIDAEEITGIREAASVGLSLLDTAREQGFAATILDLCDASANNSGTSQQGEYELQGNQYNIYSTALIGKDNFAKAFYITFIRES